MACCNIGGDSHHSTGGQAEGHPEERGAPPDGQGGAGPAPEQAIPSGRGSSVSFLPQPGQAAGWSGVQILLVRAAAVATSAPAR